MENVNIRLLVLEMLLEVNTKQAYSHVVIRDVQNKYNYLQTQEKSFMKRLFEGSIERKIELDYVIDLFSKTKCAKMKPVIRTILEMGAYQILYMDTVPDSAACNESVKLANKKGFGTLKGFVNGVLRNIARNKENLTYPSPDKEYDKYLSVKYSMPLWIVDMWIDQLGKESTGLVLEGLMKEHPVTIRLRSGDVSALKEALEAQGGLITRHPYLEDAYIIEKTDDITRLPGYDKGSFVVQDVSSQLAVRALVNALPSRDNIKVLDICAAPGGKTVLAADLLGENVQIESRDLSEYKVSFMEESFNRCGVINKVSAKAHDAREFDESIASQMDAIICDVPCSGLGVIGKKRDIKYKMTAEGIESIVRLQEEILEQAVKYLKPGGYLLFSTCTINKSENDDHVRLLKDKYGLTPVSLSDKLPQALLHADSAKDGYIQLLPGIHRTDGFFISLFKKEN